MNTEKKPLTIKTENSTLKEDVKSTKPDVGFAKLDPVSRTVKKSRKVTRETRVPLDDQNSIGIDREDGYVYRLVNDKDDRLAKFEKAGYEFVEGRAGGVNARSKDPSQVGTIASQPVGGGMQGYYMRIPKDWYDEDQKRKQKELDKKMRYLQNIPNQTGTAPYQVTGKITIDGPNLSRSI